MVHPEAPPAPSPAEQGSGWDAVFAWLDRITQIFNVAGTALIVALMVLIGADVFGRQAFNAPISGVPEMVSLSIVAIVFLQVPQALRSGRFTRSDALLKLAWRKTPRFAKTLEIVFDAVAVGILGALVYAAWPLFVKDWQRNTFVGAMGDFTAPVWPVKLILVVGTVLLIAQFLARIVKLTTGRVNGASE
ncbi:TRAP transporter small permease subunit [Pseudahrensia aquimaris]|uniref:TRAP transporter small permease protein n=1 Tax=Pseudahrensia aquimaris TaxID=744461 RepID=A0ABW3FBP9_9HYPH